MTNQAMTRRALLAATAALLAAGQGRILAQGTPGATPVAGNRLDGLLSAEDVSAILGGDGLRVVAFMPAAEFEQGRIRTAFNTDFQAFELTDSSTDAAVDRWAEGARDVVRSFGISERSRVVTYDSGTLFAARFAWVLAFLGVPSVRVMDGGFPGWRAAGLPIVSALGDQLAAATFFAEESPSPGDAVLARLTDVEAAIGDPGVVFVDTRAPEEYEAGHLPGAVNVPYTDNAVDAPVPVWKSPSELASMYADAGIAPGMRVIPYCSTGVRSAVTWFTLRGLGYTDLALFSGSWAEWTADPSRPVVSGPRP